MKQIRRRRRITPFAVLKCRHVEMHEHAEAQIYKSLLQIEERPRMTRNSTVNFVLVHASDLTTGQQSCRRRQRGHPKKLSSCRHLRRSNSFAGRGLSTADSPHGTTGSTLRLSDPAPNCVVASEPPGIATILHERESCTELARTFGAAPPIRVLTVRMKPVRRPLLTPQNCHS
jgi:hypothetical protein